MNRITVVLTVTILGVFFLEDITKDVMDEEDNILIDEYNPSEQGSGQDDDTEHILHYEVEPHNKLLYL